MIGKRVRRRTLHRLLPGEYAQLRHGDGSLHWYACTPTGLHCNLSAHDVMEHDDGAITVSPSILVSGGDLGEWHGYLRHGVWQPV